MCNMCHVKQFTSKTQKIGQKGEKIAEMFLVKRGFDIILRNYTKKTGEIDIIASQGRNLHFVEVKTIQKRGTEIYDPLQNIHREKWRRFTNTVQIFLSEYQVSHEISWQIDVIAVYLDPENREARVQFLQNVIV